MITITPIPPTTPPAIAPVWEWDEGGLEAEVEGEETGEERELETIVDGLVGRADDDVWVGPDDITLSNVSLALKLYPGSAQISLSVVEAAPVEPCKQQKYPLLS